MIEQSINASAVYFRLERQKHIEAEIQFEHTVHGNWLFHDNANDENITYSA